MFTAVSGTPTFINSKNPNPFIPRFSILWIMIMLLAAPIIDRFPAIVLPAANARYWESAAWWFINKGRYKATKGTLERNWLKIKLMNKITGICVTVR